MSSTIEIQQNALSPEATFEEISENKDIKTIVLDAILATTDHGMASYEEKNIAVFEIETANTNSESVQMPSHNQDMVGSWMTSSSEMKVEHLSDTKPTSENDIVPIQNITENETISFIDSKHLMSKDHGVDSQEQQENQVQPQLQLQDNQDRLDILNEIVLPPTATATDVSAAAVSAVNVAYDDSDSETSMPQTNPLMETSETQNYVTSLTVGSSSSSSSSSSSPVTDGSVCLNDTQQVHSSSSSSSSHEAIEKKAKRTIRLPQKIANSYAYGHDLLKGVAGATGYEDNGIEFKKSVSNKETKIKSSELVIGMHNDFLQNKNYVTLPGCGTIGKLMYIGGMLNESL